MRSGEGVEVYRGNVLEELALVEDAYGVPADETTETVSGNGEFRHNLPAFFELLHFLDNLARVERRIECRTSETINGPLQRLVLRRDQRRHRCSRPCSWSRREDRIRSKGCSLRLTTSLLSSVPSHRGARGFPTSRERGPIDQSSSEVQATGFRRV